MNNFFEQHFTGRLYEQIYEQIYERLNEQLNERLFEQISLWAHANTSTFDLELAIFQK